MSELYDKLTLDLTATVGATVTIDVAAHSILAVAAIEQSGTWGLAVVTLQLEATPDNWTDFPRTIIDQGQLQNVDVSGVRRVRLRLSTNQVGACTAAFLVVGTTAGASIFYDVLDGNDLLARTTEFDIQAFDLLYVRVTDRASWGGAIGWATAVIEWKTSIDGVNWDSYSPAVEMSSTGSVTLDVSDARFVVAHVTTAEGDALILDIVAFSRVQGDIAATDLSFTPGVLADWDGSADPGDVDDALDQLAERVTDGEVFKKTIHVTFPEAGEAFLMRRVSQVLTVTEVEAWTDVGTVDVQIEERTTLDVSGTELLTADLVADDTGETTSAFDDDSVVSGNYVVLVVKATNSSPEALWCTVSGVLG